MALRSTFKELSVLHVHVAQLRSAALTKILPFSSCGGGGLNTSPDTQHTSPDTQITSPDTQNTSSDTQHTTPDTQNASPATKIQVQASLKVLKIDSLKVDPHKW